MADSDSDGPVAKKVTKKPKVAVDSDDDAPVAKKPVKKVAADSDDDAPVAKKPAKKVAADDSDDDAPVAKKAPKKPKKAVADDSDDDAPVTRRKAGKADARRAEADSDDEGAPVPAKAGRQLADSDDEGEKHVDPLADLGPVADLIDYDAMDEAAFLEHLKAVSKRQRLLEKEKVAEARQAALTAAATSEPVEAHFDGAESYTYQFMLERILVECRAGGTGGSEEDRVKLPAPKIEKSGSKKTALTNFKAICTALGRSMEEVKDFIEKSLTTQSSIDMNNCLIIRVQNAKVLQFQKLVEQYLEQYVRCNSCHKITTTLTRDSTTRMQLLTCQSCKASRYVAATGGAAYQAQTVRRSRVRAKQL